MLQCVSERDGGILAKEKDISNSMRIHCNMDRKLYSIKVGAYICQCDHENLMIGSIPS